jgi:hypothetical protein
MRTLRRESFTHRDVHADVWKNTLAHIPSVYGRLVYLAGLRDANSPVYRHHGLALMFGREVTSKVLETIHVKVFEEWLGFDLEQQKADLDLYISEFTEPKQTIVETWLRGTPYRTLPPLQAKPAERDLFRHDLEALLEIIKNDPGAADQRA